MSGVTDTPMANAQTPENPVATPQVLRPRHLIGVRDVGRRTGLIVAWAILVLVFSILRPNIFPTVGNFSSIFGAQSVVVMLGLALLIPITAGDYDLSIASVLTVSSLIVAILTAQDHWAVVPAAVVALLFGLVVGLVNGIVSVAFDIDPFIVTLGMSTALEGVALWISNSNTISGLSPGLVAVVAGDHFLGLPLEFYMAIAGALIIFYVLEFTPVGRRLLFVGRNRTVSKLSGIKVARVRIGGLATSGFIAALAGIMYAGTTGSADPTAGSAFLLPAFAAVFLGATSIVPGRFNPWGTLIAVYFLVTGITGLEILGLPDFIQQIFYGGALVLAVVLSQVVKGRAARRESEL